MPELIKPPDKNMSYAYGVWLLNNKHRLIRQTKKHVQPSVHGDRHWDSSYLLMDYFEHNRPAKNTRVLDVGCGWGSTSIYLANRKCDVTGLDVDEDVFPFLDIQSELNEVKIKKRQGAMKDMSKKALQKFNLIVGGDICFWDELVDEWLKMLKRAAKAGVEKAVLADPGRSTFLKLIDKCEKLWPTDMLHWYALEPKRYEGFLLVVQLNGSLNGKG